MDSHLDKLARTKDPYLKKELKAHVQSCLSGGASFSHQLTDADLTKFARVYGEQYVQDPWQDLDQYLAILSRKSFARKLPTQLKILYLFGSGSAYRPNLGALSVAGEALAGFYLEQRGYRPLVRPLGIMPDAVLWKRGSGELHLAIAEAKATIRDSPEQVLLNEAFQFVLDVKTRAAAFGNRYDAFLVCSQFKDGGKIDCSCLHLDLSHYHRADRPYMHCVEEDGQVPLNVAADASLQLRLESIIRAQALTAHTNDEYLTGLLSEEATRAATVLMIEGMQEPKDADAVNRFIRDKADALGLSSQWDRGQKLIESTKGREVELVTRALQRFRRPEVSGEE